MFYSLRTRVKITTPENDNVFLERYGTFYKDFDSDGLECWLYYPIFFVKRITILITIFIITSPIVQLTVSFTFTLLVSPT